MSSRLRWRRWVSWALLCSSIAACTTPTLVQTPSQAIWRGRLALSIEQQPPERWQANFVLMGSPAEGELHILSPLGTLLAKATWRPDSAAIQRGSTRTAYADTASMTAALTGADLPLSALFAWLQGQDMQVSGWHIEHPATHLVIAQRETPLPVLKLRIALTSP